VLADLWHLATFGQEPVSLAQLADDLLGRVAASLHRVLLPIWAIGLSYQLDQPQGVTSLGQ
jgi:hypothetical protein